MPKTCVGPGSCSALGDVRAKKSGKVALAPLVPLDKASVMRDFVRVNGRSYLREPLDARWILDRFPADRAAAPT